jgi:hypothetical protein
VKPMQQALEKVDLLAPSSLEAKPTVELDASAEAQEEARWARKTAAIGI